MNNERYEFVRKNIDERQDKVVKHVNKFFGKLPQAPITESDVENLSHEDCGELLKHLHVIGNALTNLYYDKEELHRKGVK